MHMEPLTHDAYIEAYTEDENFKEKLQKSQKKYKVGHD